MNISKVGVVAGLDPAIHPSKEILFRDAMDARVEPAHDGGACCSFMQSTKVAR